MDSRFVGFERYQLQINSWDNVLQLMNAKGLLLEQIAKLGSLPRLETMTALDMDNRLRAIQDVSQQLEKHL